MKALFILLATLMSASIANARIDVSCFMNDCLSEGWHAYDYNSQSSTVVECNNFDCLNQGWITLVNNREMNYTVCKLEGCFNDGWTVYDSQSGRLLSDVSCGRGFNGARCLEFGWSTFVPNQGTYQTRCVNSDCTTSGWVVSIPGFNQQSARCKTGGCFNSGWTLFR